MNNSVLERIRILLKEKKISQRELAKGVNVSLATVNKLLNSEGDLSLYMIRRIKDYLKANEEWILVGKGQKYENTLDENLAELEEMGMDEASALKHVQKSHSNIELEKRNQQLEEENKRLKSAVRNSSSQFSSDRDVKIVFVDAKQSLQYYENAGQDDYIETLPFFILPVSRFPNKKYRAFELTGDSMIPKIVSGDWVVCEKVEDFRTIRDTYAYVLVLDYGIQCRRVINRLKERGRLRLKADNQYFGDVEITEDQVKEVWEVKCLMTFKLGNPFSQMQEWFKKLEDEVFELKEKVNRM
ncbi:MAG TPA: XRE family transcriptional regulator [Cytophagales bacterium]|nr:XRE family transcriptional regulator [Cytophagales bacterium]